MPQEKILKFLNADPGKTLKGYIKNGAYPYLKNKLLTKGPLGKTREELPGFIRSLEDDDARFGKIEQNQMKTTYILINVIYNEVKNNLRKIEKEVTDGKLIPADPKIKVMNGQQLVDGELVPPENTKPIENDTKEKSKSLSSR